MDFNAYMGIEILEVNENAAFGKMMFRKELSDFLGHMTGSAYSALADAVGGACARATGAVYVTQGCSLQFYVSTEASDVCLFASAKVRHRGSRTCIVAVELTHADGTVVCDGQYSYAKIS